MLFSYLNESIITLNIITGHYLSDCTHKSDRRLACHLGVSILMEKLTNQDDHWHTYEGRQPFTTRGVSTSTPGTLTSMHLHHGTYMALTT